MKKGTRVDMVTSRVVEFIDLGLNSPDTPLIGSETIYTAGHIANILLDIQKRIQTGEPTVTDAFVFALIGKSFAAEYQAPLQRLLAYQEAELS